MSSLLLLSGNKSVQSALYTISATPELRETVRSTTVTYTVTLTRLDFTDDVTLTVTGAPNDVTATLSPSTLSGATVTSTLTVVIGAAAEYTGGTPLIIQASGTNALPQFVAVTLTIAETPEPPPTSPWGPGDNAPVWVTETNYREELFTSPIPVSTPPNAPPAAPSGWIGFNGFPGFKTWSNFTNSYREVVYNPGPRVTYPTMQTPIGEKTVFQFVAPGSTNTINSVSQVTTSWPTWQNTGVSVAGTWSGTLAFEISEDNGTTWAPVTLTGQNLGGGQKSVTGTGTSVNGVWVLNNTQSGGRLLEWGNDGKYLRVRADAWTSGTATVNVGMKGGEEAVFARSSTLRGKKFYVRHLTRIESDYTSANVETKGFFINTNANAVVGKPSNHYFGFIGRPDANPSNDGFAQLVVQLQSSWSNGGARSARGPANGTWLDIEWVFEMNTLDQADGKALGWINGVQLLNATNLRWVPVGVDGEFRNISLIPVYGGGAKPPPRDCAVQLAAWYHEATT